MKSTVTIFTECNHSLQVKLRNPMSVFATFSRYRFPFLLFCLCLITVLLLNEDFVYRQFVVFANQVNRQQVTVLNKLDTSNQGLTAKVEPIVATNVVKTVLGNGLTVLAKEVRTAPVVSVQVWYGVGSRHEEVGLNGIAHQLEHMMFKGTKTRPIQFGRLFSSLGSDSNAFTSFDQTAYYGTVERDKLDALLVLEADRMQNALIEEEELASEKRVVISELQGYENSPEYRLSRAVMRRMFPDHPYGLPVGGTKADVENFSVEAVSRYYRRFYQPGNAVLVIVGDFDTTTTLGRVEEIFGQIPGDKNAGEKQQAQHKANAAKGNGDKPIILREPGGTALIQAVYPAPTITDEDAPVLDVVDYILSDGRTSRLYRELVDTGLASDIKASTANLVEGGWYEVLVSAAPDADLPKLDLKLQQAIAKLAKKPPSATELNRAKAQFKTSIILSNRDITSLAMQLANDQLTTGDYQFIDRYLAAIDRITPEDIQRVVSKYLQPELRTVGFFQPTQPSTSVKNSNRGKGKIPVTGEHLIVGGTIDPEVIRQYLPQINPQPVQHIQPLPEQIVLDNGMRVLLLPDSTTPTVTMSGHIRAGSEYDPEDKAGLADLVAENLMSGTKTKNAYQLAQSLESQGASLDFTAMREGVRIEGSSLSSDLSVLIHTLADAVINPTFPQKELDLARQQSLISLKQDLDDPNEVARRKFTQSLYPKQHPLHLHPTPESLRRIHRQDVIKFKNAHYRPDTTILALVGDFDINQVRSQLQREFGEWKVTGEIPQAKYPSVKALNSLIQVNSVLPGKAQTVTYMGGIGIKRHSSQYYAAQILNQVLGGDTLSSRLGAEIRDRQGLTYGIYSNFIAGRNSGTFLIEMQTSPEDTNKAVSSTRKLLEDVVKNGITVNELETAKQTLISNYIVALANPEELAYRIVMNEVYDLNREELRNLPEKIREITLAQVNQAARNLLHPDKIVVVSAGPAVVAGQGIK